MINILIKLIKLLVVNRVAYAINNYNYVDKDNSIYNKTFYTIEKVLVKDIFINTNSAQYIVIDIDTNQDWGDLIEQVYFSKRKASKELLKLCKL